MVERRDVKSGDMGYRISDYSPRMASDFSDIQYDTEIRSRDITHSTELLHKLQRPIDILSLHFEPMAVSVSAISIGISQYQDQNMMSVKRNKDSLELI